MATTATTAPAALAPSPSRARAAQTRRTRSAACCRVSSASPRARAQQRRRCGGRVTSAAAARLSWSWPSRGQRSRHPRGALPPPPPPPPPRAVRAGRGAKIKTDPRRPRRCRRVSRWRAHALGLRRRSSASGARDRRLAVFSCGSAAAAAACAKRSAVARATSSRPCGPLARDGAPETSASARGAPTAASTKICRCQAFIRWRRQLLSAACGPAPAWSELRALGAGRATAHIGTAAGVVNERSSGRGQAALDGTWACR